MNFTIKVFILFVSLSLSYYGQCQNENQTIKHSNNKVNLNGKPYYIHIVRKGETLYAISQSYKVPIDTLKLDNISLNSGIKVNQYIKIRINDLPLENKEEFIYHSVVKGDTPYNLSKRYQTTIDKIYQFNPNAELGIKIGQTLKIPSNNVATTSTTNDTIIQVIADTLPENYIVHIVKKKQTIYGIAALYKIDKNIIEEYNPIILERPIQIGEALKIPLKEEVANSIDKDYYLHTVKKQETIWGITQLYKIKEKTLNKENPALSEYGLQIGMVLKIPKSKVSDDILQDEKPTMIVDTLIVAKTIKKELIIDSSEFAKCPQLTFDTLTTYKVAFFLPLYLNMIDTSVVSNNNNDNKPKMYPRSKMFVEFYEGALLALENLKQKGVSLEIHVFDTENDSLKVARILENNNLTDFSLFIGPIFGENLTLVGDYAWEHQINIVSPLSTKNSFIDHNPYAFQASPPFELQMKHASEFLNEFDTKNYIVIHDGKSIEQEYIQEFKKQLFAQMNDENYDQIKYNEVFYYDARDSVLKDVFTPGIENIVIVPSQNQAFVSDIMGKLNGYSYEYKIITFGQPRWVRFDNIELDNFHNTNTHIFSNSYIDYNDKKVMKFVSDYRRYFKTEPDKYAFQGYDITLYFCSALNIYGNDFRKCIHNHQAELLQTKYNFVPYTDQGGYQNSAIYILEYTDEYTIKKVASYPEQ